jgi:hypothetical protein
MIYTKRTRTGKATAMKRYQKRLLNTDYDPNTESGKPVFIKNGKCVQPSKHKTA